MTAIRVAVLCAAVVAAGPVAAANWVNIGSSTTGMSIELDMDSVKPVKPPVIRVWVRTDYSAVEAPKQKRMVLLYEINCKDDLLRSIYSTRYDDAGAVMTTSSTPMADFTPIVPDSNGETVKTNACAVVALEKGFEEWLKKNKR